MTENQLVTGQRSLSLRRGLAALALAASLGIGGAQAQDPQPESGTGRLSKESVAAKDFMVSAANPLAAQAGYDVLKAGGTAIDAAVAVQMMLNLVEPQSSGIGGGAFLLYWDATTKTLETYDGREKAPAAATPEYFLKEDGTPKGFWEAVVGGRSVGVPGTLRLFEVAHGKHGKTSWSDLLQPAIGLADAGFEISPRMAKSIAGAQEKGLDKFPVAKAYFFKDDGTPKEAGSLLKNPEFAATLRAVAEGGADVFYKGDIAKDIVAAVAATTENPGILTLEDFANYDVKQRDPVCTDYRAHKVCGMGPPTSGGLTVGQILNILSHFDLPAMGPGPEAAHLFAEAGKLAYADRGLYMADSDFVRMPTKGLLDADYLSDRAGLIKRDGAMGKASPGTPPWKDAALRSPDEGLERPGTSHFVIRDSYGNAVSMTTTIETGFGSRVMVRGFLLNNELTDFSRAPEKDGKVIANRVEGGKRPRSSMAPTIVFDADGEPVLLIGSPGGSRIINYVAKTLVAVLDWEMDIQKAIDLGHFVNRNGATDLEQGTDAEAYKETLEGLGHEVKVRDLNSGLHGIVIAKDKLVGGADPRREGMVLGD
ncbi:gamma-glutamyltransferase [Pelagibius sp. Alg239-R121]|uniref:gamma-glutamyltransferase n=1 Tax=Pelagibius sp. Alg239-R121 TaxID=2993448 RepID=UPI0024A74779|nr:gamma-glutamyltransferase [Pelagibius sp. Alg239-R121]